MQEIITDIEVLSPILFKKYEIGKLLGCGAFAKVYHGRDTSTSRSVAIKSVSKQRILKGNLTANIKREIKIMRTLEHENIVRLHEVLATKTKIYFVMEFAKGGELFARVAKGRFSEDLSRRYFRQLISAVGYCHSRGVYHRDLKLENLLLDENWDLKVTDFGLSAVADQVKSDGLLHTLCGTPAYVAPEILAKRGYDGAKIDVWSCGVILYVLNAGYLPFNDRNLMTMYRRIYRGDFRCPKWSSPDLNRFLKRILDPNPSTRITVAEIMNDPWFTKGCDYKPVSKSVVVEDGIKFGGESRFLNAFDLISYSSGANISGLLTGSVMYSDVFVSGESFERITERFEEFARDEGMGHVSTKGWSMRLHGPGENSVVTVEIHRLTKELVVVDVKRSGLESETMKERFKTLRKESSHKP